MSDNTIFIVLQTQSLTINVISWKLNHKGVDSFDYKKRIILLAKTEFLSIFIFLVLKFAYILYLK